MSQCTPSTIITKNLIFLNKKKKKQFVKLHLSKKKVEYGAVCLSFRLQWEVDKLENHSTGWPVLKARPYLQNNEQTGMEAWLKL
jgi:hypothetical protein